MADHVTIITVALCITVEWVKPHEASASPLGWRIRIPKIKTEISYATALHEIGHLACASDYRGRAVQASKTMRYGELADEALAWDFAARVALRWTPKMSNLAKRMMASYNWDAD